MLFRKIGIFSIMNYFYELITIVCNEWLLSFRMHSNLLDYFKLYYRCDQKRNNTPFRRLCPTVRAVCGKWSLCGWLTFRNRASYIQDGHTATLQTPHFIYIFQQIYVLNFLNMLHTLRFFFSSKCRLFHNATFFGSYIIHILHSGCAKI